jgi:hypothetical protein
MKHNTVIMLKEILKHTSQYLENDVQIGYFKKLFKVQKMIIGIHCVLILIYFIIIYSEQKKKNYKKFRKWFLKNPL